ncbi:MAG: hypothetical protein Q8N89_03230 [Azonexus sp.]|nr:hypothetical protein [Azonexus sp.]
MKPQLTAYPALASRLNTGLCAFEAIHPLADSATWPLARLVGRPALWLRRNSPICFIVIGSFSLLLAGMSLLRRRFAPAIPPRHTICHVQPRFQGSC